MARLLIAALSVGLAACGGGDGEPGASKRPPETTVTTLVAPSTTVQAATTTSTMTPTSTRQPARLTAASRLRMDGIGPVQVGMTAEEVSAVAGVRIRVDPTAPFGPCRYAAVPGIEGLGLMIVNGRVARISVHQGSAVPIRTVSGITIGDNEAEVQRVYAGRITVEPHPYDPDGRYLVYTAADPSLQRFSLLFETDGRTVTAFRSGLKGAVAQPEGCA